MLSGVLMFLHDWYSSCFVSVKFGVAMVVTVLLVLCPIFFLFGTCLDTML